MTMRSSRVRQVLVILTSCICHTKATFLREQYDLCSFARESSVAQKYPEWQCNETHLYTLLRSEYNYCTFRGIECNEEESVVGIDLSIPLGSDEAAIVGSLQHVFTGGGLSNLKYVDVRNNLFCTLIGLSEFDGSEIPNLSYFDGGNNVFQDNLYDLYPLFQAPVVAIYLENNFLKGGFPSNIWNLDTLVHLSLHHNELTGHAFPRYVAGQDLGMKSLKYLDISGNYFTGLGDNFFYGSENLEYFDLRDNFISGSAYDIIRLKNLTHLFMGENCLNLGASGVPIDRLVSLTHLDISSLLGSVADYSWEQLVHLEYLKAQKSIQAGLTLDLSFPGIPITLKELHLGDNCLSGLFPEQILNFSGLRVLDLKGNKLFGELPVTLSFLSSLQFFDISNNLFTGEIPEEICAMNLVELTVDGNRFSCYPSCMAVRSPPAGVIRCPEAQDALLCAIEATWSVRASIQSERSILGPTLEFETDHPRSARNRHEFKLSDARADLRYVEIYFDSLSDFTWSTVYICMNSPCKYFNAIYIFDNRTEYIPLESAPLVVPVSGSVYAAVAALPADASWLANGIKLYSTPHYADGSGWSCTTYGNFTGQHKSPRAEQILAIGLCTDMPWTGVACSELSQIVSLRLPFYGLTGTIPDALYALTNLESLDISFNKLYGTIASDLFQLTRLSTLNLAGNRFSGNLGSISIEPVSDMPTRTTTTILGAGKITSPSKSASSVSIPNYRSIDAQSILSEVHLSYNYLTGSLPHQFLGLKNLRLLSLQGNMFSGEVDRKFCDAVAGAGVYVTLYPGPKLCFSSCWIALNPYDTGCHSQDLSEAPSSVPDIIVPTATPSIEAIDDPIRQTTAKANVPRLPVYLIVLISVIAFASLTLFLYLAYTSLSRRRASVGTFSEERDRRLKELPVHYAIINKESASDVEKSIKFHLGSAKERDFDGRTAVDLILSYESGPSNVSLTSMCALIEDMLPFDKQTGKQIKDPSVHVFAWASLVQSQDEKWVAVVEKMLEKYKLFAEQLAYSEDIRGRRCIDIATKRNKEQLTRKLYLAERFELFPGTSVHISDTCVVRLAYDHSKQKKKVALKFIKNRSNFMSEIICRRKNYSDKYVIAVLDIFDGNDENSKKFRDDAILRGYHEFPYCIVMEGGDQSLQNYIITQNVVNENWDDVRVITKSFIQALQHVHKSGMIHGDLKPINALVENKSIRLLNFDASAAIQTQYVGSKYSSAYSPPELLYRNADGKVDVRVYCRDVLTGMPENGVVYPYELVKAATAHDMWSLGCIIYLICTGSTLFQSSVNDNVSDSADLKLLYQWADATKRKKLDKIKDKFARNLVSLLLTKDPNQRIDCNRVLVHPFITGAIPTRMQGEAPQFDVFISYRVASDAWLARMLYNALNESELNVWLDSECLPAGMNWEQGFCSGLLNSACFVAILSREAIHSNQDSRRNLCTVRKSSECDNCLLEWRLAGELQARGMISRIFPVMVGDVINTTDCASAIVEASYNDYFRSGCHPNLVGNVVVDTVETKLREHLNREGLGTPLVDYLSAKSLLNSITSNQGGFLRGKLSEAVPAIVSSIVKMAMMFRSPDLCGIGYDHKNKILDKKFMATDTDTEDHSAEIVKEFLSTIGNQRESLVQYEQILLQKEEVIERLTKILKNSRHEILPPLKSLHDKY